MNPKTRILYEQQKGAIAGLGRRFSDATIFLHEAIAQKAGLTVTDHKYLGLIMQKGPITAGELSKLSKLTTGAVTGLVDRLERKKLVNRQFDKSDRRKIIIVPNVENTTKLFGALQTLLRKRIFDMISTFSDDELNVIEKYLQMTIDVMSEITADIKNK
jgi:DNA-binding MarR family transcriptional regulator